MDSGGDLALTPTVTDTSFKTVVNLPGPPRLFLWSNDTFWDLLHISLFFTYSKVTRSLPQKTESHAVKSSLYRTQTGGAPMCVLAEEGHLLPAKSHRDHITEHRHKTQTHCILYKVERKSWGKNRIHHFCCTLSCLDGLWSFVSYSSQYTCEKN